MSKREDSISSPYRSSGDGVTLCFRPGWSPPAIEVQVGLDGVGDEWSFSLADFLAALSGDSLVIWQEAIQQEMDKREAAADLAGGYPE